ncbi:hypothetical protein [Xanthomonas arboricola]|uniref:hypothetical protein n=1 Tax=Xanthomonas arboricola TaxID=56448 RepID=UPI004040AF51
MDAIEVRIHLGAGAHEARLQAQLAGVAAELLPHAQRHHNANRAAGMRARQTHDLQLLHGLAKAETLEEGAAPAGARPHDAVALVRLEEGVHVVWRYLEAQRRCNSDLPF